MNVERRAGKDKPVIAKALTRLDGFPMKELLRHRKKWILHNNFLSPGPLQFHGPTANEISLTLRLELYERSVSGKPSKSKKRRHDCDDLNGKIVQDPSSTFRLSMCEDMLIPSLGRERAMDQTSDLVVSDQQKLKKKSKTVVRLKSAISNVLSQVFPKTFSKENLNLIDLDRSSQSETTKITLGVVFCGRQVPAAHAAVFGLISENDNVEVLGFLNGTKGLFEGHVMKLDRKTVSLFRNQGGMDLLCRTSDSMRTYL